ncbi:MAG: biotin-dependent carboxyltransferase family protein [Lachnospiraceae bacterium]
MNKSIRIEVISPGVLTTVQDAGRFGYLADGITESGAMDQEAYRFANALVGNRDGEAELECTMQGPVLRFTGPATAALAGADMDARLDGRPVKTGGAFSVEGGQVLELHMAAKGLRTYLAVAGGIAVPKVLGSRSTNLKCRMGGFSGRALLAGDALPVGEAEEKSHGLVRPYHPVFSDRLVIHCIPGPQEEAFSEAGIETFYGSTYTVTPESDRMGMRLAGPVIETLHGSDIISDGIVFGSVQVPKSGLPILLLADHQTAGGYAKIATVISKDLPLLAQAVPGTKLTFERVSVEEIQETPGTQKAAAKQDRKAKKPEALPRPLHRLRGWQRFRTFRERREKW